MFQRGGLSASQSNSANISALQKIIRDQQLYLNQVTQKLQETEEVLGKRHRVINQCYYKIKELNGTLQEKTTHEQQLQGLLQGRIQQVADMQHTIDSQKANVRTLQTKLDYAKTHINILTEEVAKLDRRLLGKSEPVLTPGAHKWRLIKDAQQAAELHGAESVLAKAKQSRLDLFLQTEGQQDSQNVLLVAGSSQVPSALSEELAKTQEELRRVEEALRVKTLQWQELLSRLQTSDQTLSDNTQLMHKLEADLQKERARIQTLQKDQLFNQHTQQALSAKVRQLEYRQEGKEDPSMTPELQLYKLMEEVKHAAAIYGENSAKYKTQKTLLDHRLQTMVDKAKTEADAASANIRVQRRAEFLKNAFLDKNKNKMP